MRSYTIRNIVPGEKWPPDPVDVCADEHTLGDIMAMRPGGVIRVKTKPPASPVTGSVGS